MFTGATLELAEIASRFPLKVVRNCAISHVAKVPTRLPRKLVPCGSLIHLREALGRGDIAGVITTAALAPQVPDAWGLAIADKPLASAYRIHEYLVSLPEFIWKDFPTQIDPAAQIEAGAIIAPRNVRVGANTRILAGAVLHERCIIGEDCMVGNHSVLGSAAFEVDRSTGRSRILTQAGGVWIGDNVEILTAAVIVRATFGGFTEIASGAKIDNMVHVAHDCVVGQNVQIVSGALLGGRVSIGDDAFIGSNVVTSPGVTIGAGAKVSMGSVVVRDVPAGETVSGHFAVQHMKWLRFISSALR